MKKQKKKQNRNQKKINSFPDTPSLTLNQEEKNYNLLLNTTPNQ